MADRIVSATVMIDAPLHIVWEAITDFASYPVWNPFLVRISELERPAAVGERFRLHTRWASGREDTSVEEVTLLDAPYPDALGHIAAFGFSLRGWLPPLGLLRSERIERLAQPRARPTRYHVEEVFTGLVSGLLPWGELEAGFEAHAHALKAYCESLSTLGGSPRSVRPAP